MRVHLGDICAKCGCIAQQMGGDVSVYLNGMFFLEMAPEIVAEWRQDPHRS